MHPAEINKKIEALRKQRDAAIEKAQKQCPHEHVVECDYHPMKFFDSLPPRRLCKGCRLEEEGWGCGYEKLATKREKTNGKVKVVEKIDRQELYNMRWK